MRRVQNAWKLQLEIKIIYRERKKYFFYYKSIRCYPLYETTHTTSRISQPLCYRSSKIRKISGVRTTLTCATFSPIFGVWIPLWKYFAEPLSWKENCEKKNFFKKFQMGRHLMANARKHLQISVISGELPEDTLFAWVNLLDYSDLDFYDRVIVVLFYIVVNRSQMKHSGIVCLNVVYLLVKKNLIIYPLWLFKPLTNTNSWISCPKTLSSSYSI